MTSINNHCTDGIDSEPVKVLEEVNERYEGNRLFLANHKYRTFLWLTGDSIIKFQQIKSDKNFAKKLEQDDPTLFYALHRCRIIEGNVNLEKAAAEKNKELRQLAGHRASAGSPFAPFRVLWEVTRRCNRKCLYCHSPATEVNCHSSAAEVANGNYELPLEKLYQIADRLAVAKVFEVTLSGGECLLRGDELFSLIQRLRSHKIATSIISNGLLVSSEYAHRLKAHDVSVAISLDTFSEAKQSITRGRGTFNFAIDAVKLLISVGISPGIICTLTRYNLEDLDQYFHFVKELGVKTVILQNLIPANDLDNYKSLQLTDEQENQLPTLLPMLLRKHKDIFIQTTGVDFFSQMMYGVDSFDEGEFVPNPHNTLMSKSCSACHTGAFIDYLGDFYPCTSLRMLPMGNLVDSDLIALWMLSSNGRFVRNIKNKTTNDLPGCSKCDYINKCSGGCRGEAYAISNDWYALHDRCPINRSQSRAIE